LPRAPSPDAHQHHQYINALSNKFKMITKNLLKYSKIFSLSTGIIVMMNKEKKFEVASTCNIINWSNSLLSFDIFQKINWDEKTVNEFFKDIDVQQAKIITGRSFSHNFTVLDLIYISIFKKFEEFNIIYPNQCVINEVLCHIDQIRGNKENEVICVNISKLPFYLIVSDIMVSVMEKLSDRPRKFATV
jgi:hypothetical protein